MTNSNEIRVAVIGAGRAGMIHARNFAHGRIKQARLVAVVDPADDCRERAWQELQPANVWSDYHRALDDRDIDAVVVATPQCRALCDCGGRRKCGQTHPLRKAYGYECPGVRRDACRSREGKS
jgi:FlaA1/EpsC-like NDP-sugar epimerase